MNAALRTRPLAAGFGAELLDVDLSVPGSGTVEAVLDLLAEHALLIVRRQSLADAELAALARAMGPVGIASRRSALSRDHPEVMYVSNLRDEDERLIGGLGKDDHDESIWHSDQSFRATPATLSTLFCVNAPERGGGTGFISTALAWERLPVSLQQQLEGLRGLYRPRPTHEIEIVEVAHPVVLTNPRTGRRALYVSQLCHGFEGMSNPQAQALLQSLLAHLEDPGFRYTHRWRMGDLLIYDNAQLLHRREAFDGLRWLKATRSRADGTRFALVDG
jgi:taurine dioxygenase